MFVSSSRLDIGGQWLGGKEGGVSSLDCNMCVTPAEKHCSDCWKTGCQDCCRWGDSNIKGRNDSPAGLAVDAIFF